MTDVDKRIEEMKKRNNGAYLTQGVSFNKNCPRQMELLKFALERSASFSGLVKELLALYSNGGNKSSSTVPQFNQSFNLPTEEKKKNIGNFF